MHGRLQTENNFNFFCPPVGKIFSGDEDEPNVMNDEREQFWDDGTDGEVVLVKEVADDPAA